MKIETFIDMFERGLSNVPENERADLVAETRAHLIERSQEIGEAAAVAKLGSPEDYATKFHAMQNTEMSGVSLAPSESISHFIYRLLSSGIVSLVFLICLVFFVFELFTPRSTGLFYNPATEQVFFGVINFQLHPGFSEIYGLWLNLGFAVALLLCCAFGRSRLLKVYSFRHT